MKAKEGPSFHEVKLTPLDTNPVFECLGYGGMEIYDDMKLKRKHWLEIGYYSLLWSKENMIRVSDVIVVSYLVTSISAVEF